MMYALTLFVALAGTTVVGQEFQPATKLHDLDWLVGTYKCEGVLAQPDSPGEPMGPPVEAEAEWERVGKHFFLHRAYSKQNDAMTLDGVIQVGIDPKSKKLVCWGFTQNGISATGNVFHSKNAIQFRFVGTDANRTQLKATLVVQREVESDRHTVRYTSIEMAGRDVPVPPIVTAISSK